MPARADRSQGTTRHGAAVDKPATCHCGGTPPRSTGRPRTALPTSERRTGPKQKTPGYLDPRVTESLRLLRARSAKRGFYLICYRDLQYYPNAFNLILGFVAILRLPKPKYHALSLMPSNRGYIFASIAFVFSKSQRLGYVGLTLLHSSHNRGHTSLGPS